MGLINEYPRDFKGVWFPKEIWLNEELTLIEKVVLVEIQSLDCEINGCYATNSYIAKFCQCSARKASEAISKLDKLGLIHIWYDEGNTRHIKVNEGELRKAFNQFDEMEENAGVENSARGLAESARGVSRICQGGAQNLLPINISINNTNNKKDIYTEKEEKPKKKKEPKHRYGEYNHVTLTDKEYNTLVEKYGEDKTLLAIKNMDEWCEMKGKSYKSYYLALLNWGFRAAEERAQKDGEFRESIKTNKQGAGATMSTDPSEQYTKEQWADIERYYEENREDLPWL